MKQLQDAYLPMSESTYLMLLALTSPLHGYGMILKVEAMTHGRIHLGAGTIYGALTRFEKDGVIHLVGEQDRKKLYELTKDGIDLLQLEYARLCELQDIGKEELGK